MNNTHVAAKLFANDFAACLRLSDARKAEDTARRTACQHNTELVACLQADAERRGHSSIDWAKYFRNVGL